MMFIDSRTHKFVLKIIWEEIQFKIIYTACEFINGMWLRLTLMPRKEKHEVRELITSERN